MASPLQKAIFQWGTDTFGKGFNELPENRYEKLVEEMLELGFAWETELEPTAEVKAELGDVYLCLMAFAESLGIDLEKAGESKLKDLKARTYAQIDGQWQKVPNAPANAVSADLEGPENDCS